LVFRGRRRHLSRHVYVRGNHGNAVERGLETRPPLISPSCRSFAEVVTQIILTG